MEQSKTRKPEALQLDWSRGDFSDFCRAYEGYIFDLDGTLADSMPAHYRSWRQAFADNGAAFDFTWKLFYEHAGVGGLDTIHKLSARFNQPLPAEAIMEQQHGLLMEYLMQVEPVAEVAALARELKAQGAKIAVASGGEREHVLDTLRLIGLEDFFPVIVTRDDVQHSKPHPETFLRAAQWLGIAQPSRCVVFEDSLIGVDAARAAAMDWVYLPPDMQRFV